MSAAWRSFGGELARWRDAGRRVEFWWRDDDAMQPDPALSRLLALAKKTAVPLALAVIPSHAAGEVLDSVGPGVSILQHGTDHRNRAAAGEKKTEFPEAEAPEAAVARLVSARQTLAGRALRNFHPVLAPPWNRLPAALAPHLAAAGFRGLSRYGARSAALAAHGLVQVNTHVDLIAWRAGRGFAGEAATLRAAVQHLSAKREGRAESSEPTGWLTHHAVHDEAAWEFLERLFDTTLQMRDVSWRSAGELFHVP